MYNKIIISGCLVRDYIMNFDTLFSSNINLANINDLSLSFKVNKMKKNFGGNATNIAYGFSLMTDKKTHVLGSVGSDGTDFIDFLKQNKIHTSGVLIDPDNYTGMAVCLSDMDNKQIWGFYSKSANYSKHIGVDKYFINNPLVIIGADDVDVFLLRQKQCIENSIKYVYDVGMMITDRLPRAKLREGILNSGYLVLNEYEFERLIKDTKLSIQDIVSSGVKIIVTMAEKGVHYISKTEEYKVPVYSSNIEDSTGAGDNWRAGFFSAIANNEDTLTALIKGNALASICVEYPGGCNYPFDLQEFDKRCNFIRMKFNSNKNKLELDL